jgi:DNA-binding NtrC family response regulator
MMIDRPEADRPVVIVVTEDEVLVRTVAVELLNDEGFVTIEAEHAAAALEIIESRADEVDVLFTDIRMPGPMNGVELAHRVHTQWPWILLVIVSGNFSVSHAELPEGARFLSKPYSMQRVVDLIHELRP